MMENGHRLQGGSTGIQVKELQWMLRQQGFDVGEPDGIFGKQTDQALREFQSKKGLIGDGIAGPETLAALEGFEDHTFESNHKSAEQHVKRYWLFQYKPDDEKTDWLERAKQGEAIPWRINRFQQEMQIGDEFFLWRAFKDENERKKNRTISGVVARGKITHLEFEDRGKGLKVPKKDIRLSLPVKWLDPMISRDTVLERVQPKEFQFLRSPQGTVFKVPAQVAHKLLELIADRSSQIDAPEVYSNETVIRSDQPSTHDSFNRFVFAEYLARWLDRLWHEEHETGKAFKGDSFVLHLCGRWGAGKTTFMYQMDQCLHDQSKVAKPWIGIHFNAWRNQHVDPPWWGLLDRIIRKGIEGTPNSKGLRRKSYWYRIEEGDRRSVFLTLASILVLLVLALVLGGDAMKSIASMLALVSTVAVLLSKLMPGFAASAHIFRRLSSDPMEKIRSYYHKMIDAFDRPVIVFIDDLDRCKSSYVIELLESLHTLYSNPKVFFVVAADRNWISACFEEGYETFNGKIAQVEQPTGYRFLEKLFQLSLALPPISPDLKARYMDEITSGGKSKSADPVVSFDEAYAAVEKEIQDVSSESELNDYMRSEPKTDMHKQAMIAAAVIKAAKTESFTTSNRHRLTRFVDLMDANPRSMKLIVNAFGVYVNLTRVSGVLDMDEAFLDQVALWTILEIRFPRVAEYLARFPEQVEVFATDSTAEKQPGGHQLPDYLITLLGNESLKKITGGCDLNGAVIAPLTTKAIGVIVNGGNWKE